MDFMRIFFKEHNYLELTVETLALSILLNHHQLEHFFNKFTHTTHARFREVFANFGSNLLHFVEFPNYLTSHL